MGKMEPSCPCRRLYSFLLLLLLLRLSTLSSALVPVSRTFTVDQQGGGDFRSVQSAVDSVPHGNREWIRIHVKKGSYREKVTIPKDKAYIFLEGDGNTSTDISFAAHAHSGIDRLMSSQNVSLSPTFHSATFTVLADNFIARNIAFKNMYDAFGKSKADQAVAALVGGDKIAFYDCAFHGYQDTLCDFRGRHYFHRCFIMGGVDFIFGYGQSIFQGCEISTRRTAVAPGFITAQGRDKESDQSGFVFKGCTVSGVTPAYLGRAWRPYSRVIFYQTDMSGVVVSQGWDAWNYKGKEGTLMMVESGCTGQGSNTTGRVPWTKTPSAEELAKFVDLSYVSGDGWLAAQPR